MNIIFNSDLSVKKIDQEIFILDRQNSMVHALNKSGSLAWEMLEKKTTPDKIVDYFTEIFEAEHSTVEKDIQEFIQSMEKQKLLTIEP
ncbi:MAG: PqqD family protein [Chitinivibrionales bacterium]|nr:PqqD family protein [Chitinivibrionales bacterium]